MYDAERAAEKVQAFRLSVPHARAALAAIEDALSSSGADLLSLDIRPAAGGLEATLRLRNIEDAADLRLSDRLAGRKGVSQVRLEHCWARP